jgi:tungstate transport system ATP-binding protein
MHNKLSDLPIVFSEVSLDTGSVTILKALSLTIASGPPTVLLGPNGSGKSSVLHLAMGLMRPSRGSISWGGHPIEEARRLAIVFQRPVMLRRSVAANVLFAMRASRNTVGMPEKVRAVLKRVGLAGFENRPARRLSGGEQQRLALARALATNPQVLFLDEPTASLDPAATKGVEEIVQSIAAAGVKIVMATHDLGQARRLAGDVALLVRGKVMEHAPAATLFANPQSCEAAAFLRGDLVL